MKVIINALLVTCLLSFFAGCHSSDKKYLHPLTPQEMFNNGNRALLESKYKFAIENFEQIEQEHPASELLSQAIIVKAYSLYLDEQFDEAIFTIDDFIKQYPHHINIDYMYYLKAICYYDQMVDISRDQELTQQALDAFIKLIELFPSSRYISDSKLKMDFAFNQLAGKEMDIGFAYLQKNDVIAALNRFKVVIEKYNTSVFIPEALYRMVEIYYSFGLMEEAQKYAVVLGYNHSESIWYARACELLSNDNSKNSSFTKNIIRKIW